MYGRGSSAHFNHGAILPQIRGEEAELVPPAITARCFCSSHQIFIDFGIAYDLPPVCYLSFPKSCSLLAKQLMLPVFRLFFLWGLLKFPCRMLPWRRSDEYWPLRFTNMEHGKVQSFSFRKPVEEAPHPFPWMGWKGESVPFPFN